MKIYMNCINQKNLDEYIDEKKRIWKKQINNCLDKSKYNQSTLAQELNNRYVSGPDQQPLCTSQTSISRWTGKKGLKEFPDFRNMLLLADFFNVDVGYLIGETDYETFTAEKASHYMGLNEDAIKSIRKATSFDTAFRTISASEHESQVVLNKLFTSKEFFWFIQDLIVLDNLYVEPDPSKKLLAELSGKLDDDLFTEALNAQGTHWEDSDNLSQELIEAIKLVEETIDKADTLNQKRLQSIDVARYRLQKSFNNLISELYPE